MKLRYIIALLISAWIGFVGLRIAEALNRYSITVTTLTTASARLAAAREADTELTRRYMHALDDAEGER